MVEGERVTSTSPSALSAMPFCPGANKSAPAVPTTTVESDRSPRETEISISGMLVSPVTPGPKTPPDRSRTSRSVDPVSPANDIESVFVVVAVPQGPGDSPNQSCPPTTTIVASDPLATVAVTARVEGL
jgi:hypothetical protein